MVYDVTHPTPTYSKSGPCKPWPHKKEMEACSLVPAALNNHTETTTAPPTLHTPLSNSQTPSQTLMTSSRPGLKRVEGRQATPAGGFHTGRKNKPRWEASKGGRK